MTEVINNILGNYFNQIWGLSEVEVVNEIKAFFLMDECTKNLFKKELEQAFSDPSFSWKVVFSENGVIDFETEEIAVSYARKMLYEQFFGPFN
jgi:hypothetical protein